MNLRQLFYSTTLACSFIAPATATATAADIVTGTITRTDSFLGYMGVMTDISVTGSTQLPPSAFAFCIEGSLVWPETGSTRQYTLADGFGTFLDGSAPVDKTTAMLHYMVDNYYNPLMQGAYGDQSGYGFNQAVWQLTDFDGTQGSLAVQPDDDGEDARGSYALYATIMGDLYNNYGAIAPGYRSTQYNIYYLKEADSNFQSVALLTPVPEPSAVFMMLAGGACIMGVMRRRRKGSPQA